MAAFRGRIRRWREGKPGADVGDEVDIQLGRAGSGRA
jgi:hypothetical protein